MTDHRATPFLFDGLSEEHAIAPDDWRRVPSIRQSHLPAHILVVAPICREFFLRRDARAGRPAPLRPVGGGDACGGEQDERQQQILTAEKAKSFVRFHKISSTGFSNTFHVRYDLI